MKETRLEALVLQRMLYAEKLPEAMRKKLIKLSPLNGNKEYNISEPQGETL